MRGWTSAATSPTSCGRGRAGPARAWLGDLLLGELLVRPRMGPIGDARGAGRQRRRVGSTRGTGSRRCRAGATTGGRRRWRSSCAAWPGPSADEPLVLGIETSCDETGVGIVRGETLLVDAVASSVDQHARFGGVVPEVATRAHLEAMVPTIERACESAVRLADLDAIAVTSGPGLAGALLVGVAAAKALAVGLGKPLYGVNHLASHVAVDVVEHGPLPEPCVALLVSGGHSSLLLVPDVTAACARWGRRSTTRRGRRSTRWPGCWGCRSRAARTSTAPRGRQPGGDRLPAWADRGEGHGAAPVRLLVLGAQDGGRALGPAARAVGRGGSGRGRGGEVSGGGVDVLTRKAVAACKSKGRRPPHRRWRGGELPAACPRPGAVRRCRDPAAGTPPGPLHRQRGHGRRPRRRDGRPRCSRLRWTSRPTRPCRSRPCWRSG